MLRTVRLVTGGGESLISLISSYLPGEKRDHLSFPSFSFCFISTSTSLLFCFFIYLFILFTQKTSEGCHPTPSPPRLKALTTPTHLEAEW